MEVSIAEFAKRVGKSERAVHLRLERGTLHRAPSGKIDLEKGLEEWQRNSRPNGENGDYNKARTAHVFWKAELARLELEKRRRQVLETVDLRQGWATVYAIVRKARLSRKTAGELAAVGDMSQVIQVLDSAIRVRLYALVNRVRRQVRKSTPEAKHQEPEPRPDPSDYRQCLERREYYMGKLKELDVSLKRGEYLKENEVNRAMSNALSGFRNRLLAIPHRIAAEVAATSDPKECTRILKKACMEAVKGLPEDRTDEDQ